MPTIYGDILPRDRFSDDFERGAENVLYPFRNGIQLLRRDRTGVLRRQILPEAFDFIDERKQLIAIYENGTYEIRPLPCNWRCRYQRPRGFGIGNFGQQAVVREQFTVNQGGFGERIGFQADYETTCPDGGCGGRGRAVTQAFLDQADFLVGGAAPGFY